MEEKDTKKMHYNNVSNFSGLLDKSKLKAEYLY